ncbi:MAG: Wzz/FepE/Etk N-terminal domain-containing protein [Bacteroidota bacterium]
MQTDPLNLITVMAALQKRWSTLLFIVVASIIVAGITVYLVPPYYKAQATVASANPALADKARLFNSNVQNLYSYFGSGDDLDRIIGVGEMDLTYEKLVDAFSMQDYYQLSGDSLPVLRRKAVKLLRKDLKFVKTDNGQLQILVWTKDKKLSADIINRTIAIIEETEAGIWRNNYQLSQEKLQAGIVSLEKQYRLLSDSMAALQASRQQLVVAQMQSLLEQIKQYRKTAADFDMAAQTAPPAMYILEAASPAAYAERPDKPAVLLATALISFIFGCLLVLVNDRKRFA